MRNIYAKFFMLFFSILILSSCAQIYRPMMEPHYMKKHGRVKIGMTKNQVIEQWGEPYQVRETNNEEFDEIWVYVPHWTAKHRLYFKNDIVIKGDPNPEDLI
ncbi:MAG: hypothetical protein PHY73_04940 [Candidatus Omnitrophica bacterium]|nr:hypothetical protein [Candidatus Omnitrophota bacterium]